MIKVAKEKGSGWVTYKFPHPTTKKLQDKTAYIEAVKQYTMVYTTSFFVV